MPYIKKENKPYADKYPLDSGELNYRITKLVIEYLGGNSGLPLSYKRINDCLGALEGAKLELYRRVAIPYEDKKIKENGDVYPESLLTI